MTDATLFRSAEPEEPIEQEKTERSDKQPDFTPESSERPLGIDKPYCIELLEITEAKDHFEMPKLIKEIDEFVRSEIKRNKMKLDRDSYKKVLEGYLKRVPGLDVYSKTERIAELMRIDKKLLDAVREKEDLLEKPVTEMTSNQLRRYINATTNN